MSAHPSPALRSPAIVPWDRIETVLVDMDGTLLDLAFDNFFWLELVPARYAAHHRVSEAQAKDRILGAYRALEGSLAWYCIDHWTEALGMDLRSLNWEHRERIRYLPKATEFLAQVRSRGKRLWLVTNAHRAVLAVKVEKTGLDREVDALISAHDFHAPKESSEFWRRFAAENHFDPRTTLMVEDSLSVLTAARAFGLGFTLAIRRPDSSRPARIIEGFPAIDGVHELAADASR
jgi:putative hydrolase of the HAD superfamily